MYIVVREWAYVVSFGTYLTIIGGIQDVTEPSDASLPGLPEVSVKFMAWIWYLRPEMKRFPSTG
jgi:hypothetical protein